MGYLSNDDGHSTTLLKVAGVLPDIRGLDREFDYLIPDGMEDALEIGSEVIVPFRNRRVRGWVTQLRNIDNIEVQLLYIDRLRSQGPPPQVVELARWVSWRWAGKLSGLLSTASSPRIVRVQAASKSTGAQPVPTGQDVTALQDNGYIIDGIYSFMADAGMQVSGWLGSQRSSTVKYGASIVELPAYRDNAEFIISLLGNINSGIDTLSQSLPSNYGSSMGGIIILCPTYSDVRYMYAKLLHAGLKVARIPEEWHIARQGNCIALGTRQAALSPLPDINLIIVLSAHDSLYREERAPIWNAWQVVLHRAKMANAPCLLVTPCPTLAMLKDCDIDIASDAPATQSPDILPTPPDRVGRATLGRSVVPVRVVDLAREAPGSGAISDELKYAVRWIMADSTRKILLVQNRFSRLRLPACSSCNRIPRCPVCNNVFQVIGEPASTLSCSRCGYSSSSTCSYCGGHEIRERSSSLSRLQQTLSDYFGIQVLKIAGDIKKNDDTEERGNTDRLPAAGFTERAQVVLGTEAVLYRYEVADIVIFIDIDADLLAPRLNAPDEVMTMLGRAQAITRSSFYPRPTIIQTRVTDHLLIRAVISGNWTGFLSEEMRVRRELLLPPYTAVARIAGAGAQDFVSTLLNAATDSPGGCNKLSLRASRQPDDSWLVIADDHDTLCNALSSATRPRKQLRIYVDPPSV